MEMNENLLHSLSEETNREIQEQNQRAAQREPKGTPLKRDFLAEDFRDRIDNIYEAIIVMSQRARQIGQKQARVIENFLQSKARPDSGEETEEEIAARRALLDEDDEAPRLPEFEKPTVLAMNELMKGDVKYHVKE